MQDEGSVDGDVVTVRGMDDIVVVLQADTCDGRGKRPRKESDDSHTSTKNCKCE